MAEAQTASHESVGVTKFLPVALGGTAAAARAGPGADGPGSFRAVQLKSKLGHESDLEAKAST